MSRVSTNLVVMPAGPALVRALAPADAAGRRIATSILSLVDAAGTRPIHLVGSRSARWETDLEGSFGAWGAPQVTVGAGRFLPELVQRHVLGERSSRIEDVRGSLGVPDPSVLTLVALDGSAGLTARAPLTLLDRGAEADRWCRDMLSGGQVADPGFLSEAGVLEPELWLQLAALTPRRAALVEADTSHGVGRYVAAWEI
ncbi:hypothetical protein [Corynebacterium comes]|uniref:Uncharacterized protein n=1 Tax=Corynebacterium comes TaxID=2675218 RepID=A0A6B8W0I1_9CORY|nr:hypothetical protein [Corynebacterium comes]QGU04825.1 hypothetical protein CETAM_07855 [Corynebacterium comes]